MEHFMLLKSRYNSDTNEMDSFLKHQVLDDLTNFHDSPPQLNLEQRRSRLLSSQNSSFSSIRSQSPDFSTTLNLNLSSKRTKEMEAKREEKKRQEALNKSLEEISRELKEIEDCFTVAEEILLKEKERDEQLYCRENERKTNSEQQQNDKNENNIKMENKNLQVPKNIKSPDRPLPRRTSSAKSLKSPTFKIHSLENRHNRGSPLFCKSRLYFKNGVIGCEEAEKVPTNICLTHEIVKHIIDKENDCPLVSHEDVEKVLNKNKMYESQETVDVSTIDDDRELSKNNEVSTPIEDEKISVTEPESVLNDEYRRMSETQEKIPIPDGDELVRRRSSIPSSGIDSLHPEQHQFVRERLRHLVSRFSDRTRRMRTRLEIPPTPSSSHNSPSPPPSASNRITQIDSNVNNNTRINDGRQFNCGYWICPIFCGKGHEEEGLDPQGRFYISWLFIVSLSFLYNSWVIPLRSSFKFQTEENTPIWLIIDYCADIIYLLDVLFVKHRLIYLYSGFWQKKRRDTRINYMKKLQFKMDVLALIPLDFLYLKYGFKAVLVRLPRLLKIQSFWEFFKLLDRVIASPHMVRVAKTLTYMLYMIHLTACAYFKYSDIQGLGTNRWVFSGKGHPYVRCFAFATKTATSIGKNPKPENEGELLFMTAAWLMGVFVFALLIGQIRDIIATATRSQSEYKQLVDETLEYMRRLRMPADVQRKVKMWFTFTWEQQRTLDESHILDALPANLKTDIAISVHMQTLSKVQLFAECDEALLRELVLKLKSVTFIPGDFVCKKGEVGKEMYIIKVGEVQVMGGPKNDIVLATLSNGSYFGEISLLAMNGTETTNRRTADVRSKGFSNLFVLSKSDLNEALVYYPDANAVLKRRARSLMQTNAAREAKEKLGKIDDTPDVVIGNRTRQVSPPKLISTVMQSLPKESIAVKLLTQGSRRIKREKEQKLETNDKLMGSDNSIPPIKNETILDSDLLFCIQNELKHKHAQINLTDNEKSFILRETSSDPCLLEIERPTTSVNTKENENENENKNKNEKVNENVNDKDNNDNDDQNNDTPDPDNKCDVTVHREMQD